VLMLSDRLENPLRQRRATLTAAGHGPMVRERAATALPSRQRVRPLTWCT